MTNKQRSVVFILCSTIFTIVLMLGIVLVLSVAVLLIFKESGVIGLPLVFMVAMFAGTLVSQKVMNFVIKKWNLEDKMDPLFSRKGNKRSRLD